MSIPDFTLEGVLPPFRGDNPGGPGSLMSPFQATPSEVVERFGRSDGRTEILARWLEHRKALARAGISEGFQWLDGSFVEDKEPNDLDVVLFLRRPSEVGAREFLEKNIDILERGRVKRDFRLDLLLVDLGGTARGLVDATRYYLQLFSHQRDTFIWKGIVHVPLYAPAEDTLAGEILAQENIPAGEAES